MPSSTSVWRYEFVKGRKNVDKGKQLILNGNNFQIKRAESGCIGKKVCIVVLAT